MSKTRNRESREQLTEALTRVTLPPNQFHSHSYIYVGEFEVHCPKCDRPALIKSVCIWMELSCGCTWHDPDQHRKRDKEAWVSYAKEEEHA